MTDLPSIVGAYGLVIGGLALYVLSLGRRARAARRVADAVRREREHGPTTVAGRAITGRHGTGP